MSGASLWRSPRVVGQSRWKEIANEVCKCGEKTWCELVETMKVCVAVPM